MSIRADLIGTFSRAKGEHGLSEEICAKLFWEVVTDLGWDFEGAPSNYDPETEIELARVELFGD